ncbi:hypothetical protein ABZ307_40055 [Streptomyces griseorubiginosus]|uniref:hypothetical protein n=1 Tax=Streptomyces griseorubiginosus TaxID=67304 RepID=UPI0033B0F7A6
MGANGWSAVAGVGSTVLALAAVAIALAAYRSERRRARFESARALHDGLTTGEVAAARAITGYLHYGEFHGDSHDVTAGLNAYFTLLWCFERIEAGRTALLRDSFRGGAKGDGAVQYLDSLIAWHVAEYACGLATARRKLAEAAGRNVSDPRSTVSFGHLLHALQDGGLVDRSYQVAVCPGATCPCDCHQVSTT